MGVYRLFDVPERWPADLTLRDAIVMRERVNDEDAMMVDRIHGHMADLCLRDIPAFVRFLDDGCTADELSWLSEIYDSLVGRSQSVELVRALRRAIARYPQEDRKYQLTPMLDDAVRWYGDPRLQTAVRPVRYGHPS